MSEDPGETLRSRYAGQVQARSIFSTKAADYAASRPDYPVALFEMLRRSCALSEESTIADVGAGTGLLTRGLLGMGCRVVAVEPNLEMRQTSDRLFSGIERYRSVDGCAESMPLDSASVDLITAAQAFHWFEIDQARAEFLRVLTSRGQVALIWNDRVADDPLHVALDELFGEYRGPQRAATIAREERSRLPSFFGASQPKEYSWPHGHFLSEEGLLSLVFSRSYTPAPESTKGHELADRVRQVFGRFQCDGKVDVRYQTVAFLGRPS